MAAFGTVFMPQMAFTTFENNQWNEATIVESDSIQLHPGAHVLHYSSTCFEGLK
ncbi:MAG: branched-chain amino acid aminotransferase, partial [Paraglaciecola sp.]